MPENRFIIMGDNDFWYATIHGSKATALDRLSYIARHCTSYSPPNPERLYLYEVQEVEIADVADYQN